MNKEAKQELENIFKKSLPELTEHDKGFLRARRDYLSEDQKDYYKDALTVTKADMKEADKQDKQEAQQEQKQQKKSYKELQAKAKEMNLPYVGVSREELERSTATVEGPINAPKPE